ncbi:hypothetical protein [Prevotella dentasini]|uniref:hypothetical protein n=1 Tax=Prevotella dentasini TaxID=589537 RepID=UPI0011DC78FD|nr:hypothetical protein [Prevotella dentasini]
MELAPRLPRSGVSGGDCRIRPGGCNGCRKELDDGHIPAVCTPVSDAEEEVLQLSDKQPVSEGQHENGTLTRRKCRFDRMRTALSFCETGTFVGPEEKVSRGVPHI